jgi:uncharacterized repeat protein (TIGR03803 family)
MENLMAKCQSTNCARKNTALCTSYLERSITMMVIVLGLLSIVSNAQVARPESGSNFELDRTSAAGNLVSQNDGFAHIRTPRLLPTIAGTPSKKAPSDSKLPKIPGRPAITQAAAVPNARQFVLRDFASPPNGAYPSTGVIRDYEGNLYGTTNGAYSDIGGGGSNNAGVVFKVDTFGNETVLYSFTGGADGSAPNGLVRDSAGNLYGTTAYGGSSGAGVVFKVDKTGRETVLYSFTGGADGGNPYAVIRDLAGNLYGVTEGGGNGVGVVFKIDTSGHETTLYSFTGAADGAYPNGVIRDWAGNLYGTTTYGGGASGAGVVFKLDVSGNETVLYSFTGGADGANSDAGLLRDKAGNLYGTTAAGGTSGAGVVFKVDKFGHEVVLYSFTGGGDGANPYAPVSSDSAGNLYGTTAFGGAAGEGVLFRVDTHGNETVLRGFKRGTAGDQPYESGVILDSVGNLYGTNAFSGAGGQGVVYKMDSSGNETVVYAFPGAAPGQYPYNAGILVGSDGLLYGMTFYGGKFGHGVVYDLDGGGNEKVMYNFAVLTANGFGQPTGTLIRDSTGNLYGTTFSGPAEVGYGNGVVFKLNDSGHSTVLHNFSGGPDGGDPYGGVVLDSNGSLYGTASGGGASGAGVVFKIDAHSNETVLYSFTGGADGSYPLGSLIRDSKGNLYGTTNGGGVSGAGVVFKIDPLGNETVLYSFTGGADGAYPLGGITRDWKGNLYGTTNQGGASGAGVVFKIDVSGNETVVYSFTGGADGAYPQWVQLARDSAGNLYGTTAGGGASNVGVVFKVDTSGNETVLHAFTGGSDGANPLVGVTFGPGGRLYGTTAFGGQTNAGVAFQVTP